MMNWCTLLAIFVLFMTTSVSCLPWREEELLQIPSFTPCATTDDCLVLESKCINGECVVESSIECPEHMHYVECLTRCSKTCQSTNLTNNCLEHAYCKEGCECVEGYYWVADTATCVTQTECEQLIQKDIDEDNNIASKCPEFSVFEPCPSKCPVKTCETLNNDCVYPPNGCAPKRCVCRPGFVQSTNNFDDGCIPEYECEGIFPTTISPEVVKVFKANKNENIEGSGESDGFDIEGSGAIEGSGYSSIIDLDELKSFSCPANSTPRVYYLSPPFCSWHSSTYDTLSEDCARPYCECNSGFIKARINNEVSCVPINDVKLSSTATIS